MKSLMMCLIVLLYSCGKIDRGPIREDVVCDDCDDKHISWLTENFLNKAMYKPKSMFCVWKSKEPSCVQIPKVFKSPTGGGIMKAKREFKINAKNMINNGGSIINGATSYEGVFKKKSIMIASSKENRILKPIVDKSCKLAVLCDRSPSSRNSCKYEMLNSIYKKWVYHCGHMADSVFMIGVPGYDRLTSMIPIKIYPSSNSVPENLYVLLKSKNIISEKVRKMVNGAIIAHKNGRKVSTTGSAIMECLSLLVTQKNITHLIMLSDMRQVSLKLPFRLVDTKTKPFGKGTTVINKEYYYKDPWWNFERFIPPSAYFIRKFHERKLHVGLKGVVVDICGMHHNSISYRWTSDMSARLTDLWEKVFLSSEVDRVEFFGTNCPRQI